MSKEDLPLPDLVRMEFLADSRPCYQNDLNNINKYLTQCGVPMIWMWDSERTSLKIAVIKTRNPTTNRKNVSKVRTVMIHYLIGSGLVKIKGDNHEEK